MSARHCLFSGLVLAVICSTVQGITLPESPPELPSEPERWINSSPLTYDEIRGKGVVFWYFEETCPKCKRRWPKLMDEVAQFADQPVLFVAVNSGCSRNEIIKYVEDQKITWPVLVDPDRSFEAASGEVAISLQTITEVRMVKPDRTFMWGWWNDIPMTVEHATQGATWKFKYDKVPEELKFAARRLEFGDMLSASSAIRSSLESESEQVRQAAAYMQGYIHKQMQKQINEQLAKIDRADLWLRYTALDATARRFAPLPLPPEEATELKNLSMAPEVADEQRANKGLTAALVLLEKNDEKDRQKALTRLQRIVNNFSETHAAKEAKELLKRAESTPNFE